MIELSAIQRAAARLAGHIQRTPILGCRTLGEAVGVELVLKAELFQETGSFKARGALNKVLDLDDDERSAGLITVSAGNHAAAVAWAGQVVSAPVTVVMPADAPPPKIEAVQGYGASIVFHEDRSTLFDRLEQEQQRTGATFVHPFDDPTVLAGAGTVGLEILEDVPAADAVVVPVGGGGLLGGVASAVKQLNPRCRVVAVELAAGPGLAPALAAGRPVAVIRPTDTLADGMTPPFVGELPLQIAAHAVDQLLSVTEEQLIVALRLLMTRAKLCAEASGAAATAAILSGAVDLPAGARVVAIVSGGNLDLARLATLFAPGDDP